jgi:dipeptidase E
VGLPPHRARLAFVPTAGAPYDEAPFVDADRRALVALGFQVTDLDLDRETQDAASVERALAAADVLFVAGGNTFYLLQHVRRSGLASVLPAALERGLLYIGASAGAVIAGLDTEPVAAFDDPAAAPELTSYTGLGLAPFVVLPHYGHERYAAKYEAVIRRYRGRYPIVPLEDDQGVVVEHDGTHRLIAST